jgi:hypothetical protein
VDALLEVEFEVRAEDDLSDHEEEDSVAELRVDVILDELPAAVHVAESETEQRDDGAKNL